MKIEIEDIKTLSLKPGQLLLIQVDPKLPLSKIKEYMKDVGQKFRSVIPNEEIKILVIGSGTSLSILDPISPSPCHQKDAMVLTEVNYDRAMKSVNNGS